MSLADQIVTLATNGETDTLRALLLAEAMEYSQITMYSMLVLDIESARGDLDDAAAAVLTDACPHPLFDSHGYCVCGADLSTMEVM